MRYPYLLFDADNTLFDFDRSNRVAFNAVCAAFSLPDDDETFALYERCNNAMWAAFDRGECTKDFLVVQRFRNILAALGGTCTRWSSNPICCPTQRRSAGS